MTLILIFAHLYYLVFDPGSLHMRVWKERSKIEEKSVSSSTPSTLLPFQWRLCWLLCLCSAHISQGSDRFTCLPLSQRRPPLVVDSLNIVCQKLCYHWSTETRILGVGSNQSLRSVILIAKMSLQPPFTPISRAANLLHTLIISLAWNNVIVFFCLSQFLFLHS